MLRSQMEEAKLNDIIDRLLEARNGRPGKQVHLVEAEIKQLCMTAREIFMAQPNLLELEAPIKICGAARGLPSVVPQCSCPAVDPGAVLTCQSVPLGCEPMSQSRLCRPRDSIAVRRHPADIVRAPPALLQQDS